MKHIYDDGGRAAAGYKGRTGDCVARAIAIAAELPYEQVYETLARGNAGQFFHSIHTYLRKYCNDPVTTLLYHLIARSEGIGVWQAFIKGAAAEPTKARTRHANAIRYAEAYTHENDGNPKNLYMSYALKAWPKSQFEAMISTFKKDKWVNWL